MKHQVNHCGVTVNVRKVSVRRDGVAYAGWQILDYSNGKRVRHQRPTLKSAKAKAREVCECLARGKREVLEWDEHQRLALRQSLHLLSGTGIGIDRGCGVLADALKLCAPGGNRACVPGLARLPPEQAARAQEGERGRA